MQVKIARDDAKELLIRFYPEMQKVLDMLNTNGVNYKTYLSDMPYGDYLTAHDGNPKSSDDLPKSIYWVAVGPKTRTDMAYPDSKSRSYPSFILGVSLGKERPFVYTRAAWHGSIESTSSCKQEIDFPIDKFMKIMKKEENKKDAQGTRDDINETMRLLGKRLNKKKKKALA
ncbi:MAG: hypothetical protein NT120_05115 [Candidatus Aenigmarchaeota archaeon]|nr:hypothetical protein [Candidatus Aenigmarchaeota archaeon]